MMALGSGSSNSSDTKDIVTTEANDSSSTETTSDGVEEADTSSTDVTIEQQVLVDQNNIVITAVEYTTDSIWEMVLSFS